MSEETYAGERQRQQSRADREAEEADDRPHPEADAERLEQEEDVDPDSLVRTQDGELIDPETGLIVEENDIDYGPEWRAYDESERRERSRVGAPLTEARHDRGLTTDIGWQDKDAHGRQLSPDKRQQMRRLRTWQQRIRTQKRGERNLQFALSEIDRMASALGVPRSVREIAAVTYRRCLKEDLIRGRSIEAVATAALYLACRQEHIPRTLDEAADVSRVGRNEIGRTYRYVAKELGLELEPVDPAEYVSRFCSELNMDDQVEPKARDILRVTTDEGLHAGKAPAGVAAAAVYLAGMICNCKRTQVEVAEAAGVTEVTIRNRYQEQLELIAVEQ